MRSRGDWTSSSTRSRSESSGSSGTIARCRDLSELRGTLDDGAVLIGKAWTVLRAIKRPSSSPPPAASVEGKLGGGLDESLEETLDQTAPLVREFAGYWQRLMLRFPVADAIPKSWDKTMDAFANAATIYRGVAVSDFDQAMAEDVATRIAEFDDGHANFLLECRTRFGVEAKGDG